MVNRIRERLNTDAQEKTSIKEDINKFFSKIVPKSGTKAHNFYLGLIKYTRFKIEDIYKVKSLLFLATVIIFLLAHATNVGIYTKEIYNKFDYYTDIMYQYKGDVPDQHAALQQEVHYLEVALKEFNKNEITQANKEDIQEKIKGFIREDKLYIPADTMANKIYNRIADYYNVRKVNYRLIFLISILICFIPEVILYCYSFIANAGARQELRFLKKLIIMNGSIKPVDFMELLDVLADKSNYFKNILVDIRDKNNRNDVDNRSIYSGYIRETKELDLKLFYEKLDQANNYNFSQAIKNIENEFKIEKREQARRIRKRINLIDVIGIMLFMILITILVAYMLLPWMESYKMNQLF